MTANPNIAARLAERAALHPDRPAIIEGRGRRRRVLSFGELASRVAALGDRLRAKGVEPGDRALIFVPMSADLYVGLLGVLHAGGVAVFLDAWANRSRLNAAVRAAGPRVLIGSVWLRVLSRAMWAVPMRVGPRDGGTAKGRDGVTSPRRAAVVGAEDHALVTFTTGSTGRPKAAARSHGFLWAQHQVLARHLGLREDDVDMPTLPIFVLNNLASGVTTVLPAFDPRRPADIDPAVVLGQMRDERVTTTTGSPAFYERLAHYATGRGERIPVRALFTGGAPVFPPLARSLMAATAGAVHVLYGSTEAEPIASIPAAELAERTDAAEGMGVCAGFPVPEIDLRILTRISAQPPGPGDWQTGETGEAGEIVVSGSHVLRGYLNDPEAEAESKIRDGDRVWHRTGDGGLVDGEGRLWLLGRVGQRVEVEGKVWWPMAAEARALAVPGVRHASYLGVDRPSGMAAVLCLEVEPASGRTGAGAVGGLEGRVREALSPIPVGEVRVLDRIPRDPRHASKTDVVRLREVIGGE